ncbi:death domain-containing protein [Sansalvadorimonas verongulae]|uniref:death domain-containing protein n=1 Tax=Sansalvadorimonas verongulae TaxID=2172824 RepID=UPI0012BB5EF4|nr:death domain-containing protein [Sansalvadorimonas verongulae]
MGKIALFAVAFLWGTLATKATAASGDMVNGVEIAQLKTYLDNFGTKAKFGDWVSGVVLTEADFGNLIGSSTELEKALGSKAKAKVALIAKSGMWGSFDAKETLNNIMHTSMKEGEACLGEVFSAMSTSSTPGMKALAGVIAQDYQAWVKTKSAPQSAGHQSLSGSNQSDVRETHSGPAKMSEKETASTSTPRVHVEERSYERQPGSEYDVRSKLPASENAGGAATVNVHISHTTVAAATPDAAPAPAAPAPGLGGMFEQGMTAMANMIARKRGLQAHQQNALDVIQQNVEDDLSSYRLKLNGVTKSFVLKMAPSTNWALVGIAWRHVGGKFEQFYGLMKSKPNERRQYLKQNSSEEMQTNIMLKYVDLMPRRGVSADERAVVAGIEQQGIDLNTLREMVTKEFKTQTALVSVDSLIKSFFMKHASQLDDVAITDTEALLGRLGLVHNPRVIDFKSLLNYMDFSQNVDATTYGKLVVVLSNSVEELDEDSEITFDKMLRSSVPSDDIYENGMRDAFLDVLGRVGTDEEMYAVMVKTAGKLVPQRHSSTGGDIALGGASNVGQASSFIGLSKGYQYAGIFDEFSVRESAAGRIYSKWVTLARSCNIEDCEIEAWKELSKGNGKEGALQFLTRLKNRESNHVQAEDKLFKALMDAGQLGIVGTIWIKSK